MRYSDTVAIGHSPTVRDVWILARKAGFRGPLNRVGNAVEFCTVPPVPQSVKKVLVSGTVVGGTFFRDDGIGATCSGKTGTFRKAAELNGHLFGAFDLVNRFRQRCIIYKCLIGCVK